jgi:hypothetical protein
MEYSHIVMIAADIEGAGVEGKIEFNLGITTALGRAAALTDYHTDLGIAEYLASLDAYINVRKFYLCIVEKRLG